MSSVADLSARIKGDVVTPDHPDYAESLHRWARNAERNAAIVVFVKDNDDVAAAIKYARANNLPIAVHGGGHDTNGASSAEGGLVIDLARHLTGVRIDPTKKLAYVEGGAIWATVDKAAIEHGLAVVGGSINHTGVAGLTLAGGVGWLTSEHGLTIDSLVQVTIVGADGTVRKANDTENTDLFFGVRGGGGNFGVVTELIFNLQPQRKTVFAGPIIFPGPLLKNIVDVAQEWFANVTPGEAVFLVTTTDPTGNPIVICTLFYNGSEEEGRNKFKKLYEIGPVADLAKEIPYEQLNALSNQMATHGKGVHMRRVNTEGPVYEPIAKTHERIAEVAKAGKFNVTTIYEWYSFEKVNSVPVQKTAFPRNMKPNCLIMVGWPRDAHSEEKTQEGRILMDEIVTYVTGGPKAGTGNTSTTKSPAETMFKENYPALQAIKKKYDPENVFNKWFAITPN